MGLIRAGLAALGGVLGDQWKEFFYCEAFPNDVLAVKGMKRTSWASSNHGNDNIISNGSAIDVADGQAMIIVEDGKVVEFCAEPGRFTYDKSSEPSIFCGNLGDALKATFEQVGRRFTFGGDTGKDQRVYYFNTKEILDNKFGTPNPVGFRAVDRNIGLDLDVQLCCSGTYTWRIADPMLFYTNVCGNVEEAYTTDQILPQMKSEFISALNPALSSLADLEMRPNQIPAHTGELNDLMNQVLSEKWVKSRGIVVCNVAVSNVTLTQEDMDYIKQLQRAAAAANPNIGAGLQNIGSIDIGMTAAANPNGAANGFIASGFAQGTSANVANMYAVAAQANAAAAAAAPQAPAAPAAGTWTCPTCGKENDGNFCPACGTAKPVKATWFCPTCGKENDGNFCPACGTKKPE